ncbi:hypothetical protein [Algibacter mikhailovii]|uniref:Uncharacterized protein n=1 Tax=Algibacter mikhailovii TaxID=425498 RepID=A0A918VC70_9FLAO|nr:hypothetical protein [Algibacter mikhailovii]GGZ88591.1 hypothetical protein GCM10007028_28280 [Algibacter mikhailovii]
MYNNQLLYFHSPPPPPPPKDIPFDEIKPVENTEIKKYDSDKIILEGKFAIVMDNENDLKKSDLKMFPTEFKEIYANPYHLISVEQLRKIDLRDSFNKKIPILNKQGIKIQDLAEKNKVLGILFVSEIKFNKEFNKAILIFASYTHELAGSTSVIGLKKIKGKWEIKHGQILSES